MGGRPTHESLGATTRVAPEAVSLDGSALRRVALLLFHRKRVEALTLGEGERLVVGREPGVDVMVDDESLSRRHAAFLLRAGEVWVEDLGSTNGTKLDGLPVKRERLLPGAEVRMGTVRVAIHLRPEAPRVAVAEHHEAFQRALADEAMRARTFQRGFALLLVELPEGTPWARAATTLRTLLRPVDRLGRYSDTVIEILLPEAQEADSRTLAERARKALGGGRVGLALCPPTSPEEAIHAGLLASRRARDAAPIVLAEAARGGGEHAAVSGDDDAPVVVTSPLMREVYQTVERLARSTIPVMLVGETGSGKEVVARAIHERGPRRDKKLVTINCGAIPATLIESVLFGHVKGAFTGATEDGVGIFEEADGGTVFLDEVGELSPATQVALLRVLETKRVRKVGSRAEIAVDARLITATHRDLTAMCASGAFRQDLLYRINTMVLEVPALRERPEEILPLAQRFLREAKAAIEAPANEFTPEAVRALLAHAWPGNVRELRNVVERAVVIARGELIDRCDLPEAMRAPAQPLPTLARDAVEARPASSGVALSAELDFAAQMAQLEREVLLDALRRAEGNRKRAAELLAMPVRTLSHKLAQHGIKKEYSAD